MTWREMYRHNRGRSVRDGHHIQLKQPELVIEAFHKVLDAVQQ
jgi:hypothetical protein